jgi:hypothetical protein
MESSTKLNTFHETCTDNKDVCTILGNIPKIKACDIPLLYQQSKTPPLPEAAWGTVSGLEQSSQGTTCYNNPAEDNIIQ